MLTFIKSAGYRQIPSGNRRSMGLYQCSCGNKKIICISAVNRKKTNSCGCKGREQIRKLGLRKGPSKSSYKHGMFGTRFYSIYSSIVERTKDNPTNVCRFYGCRGIRNEWKNFQGFYDDMFKSYQSHIKEFGERDTTIDRLDSTKNYYKENCRWATRLEQGGNRRNNCLITINGETKRISEWSRILKMTSWFIKKKYSVVVKLP